MSGVIVLLDIKFFQTSTVILASQAKRTFILLNNKILHKLLIVKHLPFNKNFSFFLTQLASHKIANL